MREPILVINAGSSSIKFSMFETTADRSLAAGAHGQVSGIGTTPRIEVADAQGGIPPRHSARQRGAAEFLRVRPGRDRVKPPFACVRGNGSRLGRRDPAR